MTGPRACKDVEKLLERYLDGELGSRDSGLVLEELAQCDKCRQQFESLQKMRALIREVYVEEVKSADLDGLLPGVLRQIEQQKKGLWSRVLTWLERYQLGMASPVAPVGVAVTIAVAVVAATLIYVSHTGPVGFEVDVGGSSDRHLEVAEKADGATRPVHTKTGQDSSPEARKVVADGAAADVTPRRPQHDEKPFRKNECYITYYKVDSGIVIVDVDPDGDAPTVVWHFSDENNPAGTEEDNRI
jgi:hypothetical protein